MPPAKAISGPVAGLGEYPLIDLDLGRACKYGYRTWPARVTYHADAPQFDLRQARLRAGLYQETLAALLGAPKGSVSWWERNAQSCPTEVRSQWRHLCRPTGRPPLVPRTDGRPGYEE